MGRFKIRALMILVAVVACVLWAGITGIQLRVKSQRYRALATRHATEEANARFGMNGRIALLTTVEVQIAQRNDRDEILKLMRKAKEELALEISTLKKDLDREGKLKRTYDRIARHPWLPAPPEPK